MRSGKMPAPPSGSPRSPVDGEMEGDRGQARSEVGVADPSLDLRRARHYRLFFGLAAAVSAAFAIWAGLFPSNVLDVFQVDRPAYSILLRGLGLVDGLIAVRYAYTASNLRRANTLNAIGLAVRVISPVGCLLAWIGRKLTARSCT